MQYSKAMETKRTKVDLSSCLFAFAEEFGWRGFLLQQLSPLGVRRVLLVSGP
jgi:membrane protease YdiL (CAAX protease family)